LFLVDDPFSCKGIAMHVRFDSPAGTSVPDPERTLQEMREQLAAQQKVWADKLGRDPGSFAELEPQVHETFRHYADRLVASLLAQAGQEPELEQQVKKK
jgi:hypothetical protein